MNIEIDASGITVRYCPHCKVVLTAEESYVNAKCLEEEHEIATMTLAEFLNTLMK